MIESGRLSCFTAGEIQLNTQIYSPPKLKLVQSKESLGGGV